MVTHVHRRAGTRVNTAARAVETLGASVHAAAPSAVLHHVHIQVEQLAGF